MHNKILVVNASICFPMTMIKQCMGIFISTVGNSFFECINKNLLFLSEMSQSIACVGVSKRERAARSAHLLGNTFSTKGDRPV